MVCDTGVKYDPAIADSNTAFASAAALSIRSMNDSAVAVTFTKPVLMPSFTSRDSEPGHSVSTDAAHTTPTPSSSWSSSLSSALMMAAAVVELPRPSVAPAGSSSVAMDVSLRDQLTFTVLKFRNRSGGEEPSYRSSSTGTVWLVRTT